MKRLDGDVVKEIVQGYLLLKSKRDLRHFVLGLRLLDLFLLVFDSLIDLLIGSIN